MGDFNTILETRERQGEGQENVRETYEFREFVDNNYLGKMRIEGIFYTWESGMEDKVG